MTALGIDISEHNPGLIIPTDGSVDYVLARASLAETKKDTLYRSFHDQCKKAGIPFAAYHFVYPPLPGSTYAEQATNFHSVVGDTSIPVMLDVETDKTTHPTVGNAVGVSRALKELGYRVPLIYLPHWYWNYLGNPTIPAELGALMTSSYGSNTPALLDQGYAARGGDSGSGWTGYGGRAVGIWQFTSNALVGGQSLDGGACKAPLANYFTLWGATGDDMTPEQEAKLDAVLSAVTTRDADGAYRQIADYRNDITHANTVPGIKKSVSDTSASVLAAVAQLAAKVTDLQDAVAQLQPGTGGGGPLTVSLTGTATPSGG
jgi:GH25 family lysozyme M1 (1,4-beta-N-acetylmuramidase)